jgi:hypothetical protein
VRFCQSLVRFSDDCPEHDSYDIRIASRSRITEKRIYALDNPGQKYLGARDFAEHYSGGWFAVRRYDQRDVDKTASFLLISERLTVVALVGNTQEEGKKGSIEMGRWRVNGTMPPCLIYISLFVIEGQQRKLGCVYSFLSSILARNSISRMA